MKSFRSGLKTYFLKKQVRVQCVLQKFYGKTMSANKAMLDLGYAFNKEGELRKIGPDGMITDEPFHFNISKDQQVCQAHYEKLADAVSHHLYELLETQVGLTKVPVPKDSTPETGTFIFVSKDYDKKDVLLVLIHGSGAVRAGQWARSLIINDNMDKGSQIPYIKQAYSRNYGVVVMNTNDNIRDNKNIPGSGNAEEHSKYVWENYIMPTRASNIVVVGHSYGGCLTIILSETFSSDFEQRVKAAALTDSVHRYSRIKMNPYLKSIARNWICSPSPVGTPINTPEYDVMRLSAGTTKHELTSYTCMDSVFKFFDDVLDAKPKGRK